MILTIAFLALCAIVTFAVASIMTRSSGQGLLFAIVITSLAFFFFGDRAFTFPIEITVGAFFIFGAFWFWALVFALAIILFCVLEYETKFWGGASILITLLLLEFFGDIKVFSYAALHPGWVPLWIAAYFGAGAVWAPIKWWLHTGKISKRIQRAKEDFLEFERITGSEIPMNLKSKWHEYGHSQHIFCCHRCVGKSKPKNHKAQILRWIYYWPWSVAWFIISDFVKRIAKEIYRQIEALLQRISDYRFRNIKDDLPS